MIMARMLGVEGATWEDVKSVCMFPRSPPVGTDLLVVWTERTAMQALRNRVSRNCKHRPVRWSGSDTHPHAHPLTTLTCLPGPASHALGACLRPLSPGRLYLCTCRSAAWRPGRRVTWLLLWVWRCSFLFFCSCARARVCIDIDIF